MNVFGRRSDRWRKNRKRGVSPIIATILLVAITVVLAAVLYVLISGLTKTGASTPYSLGMAVQGVTGPANTPATYYITLSLSPTSGLTTALFGLSVTNVAGATQTNTAASGACTNGLTTPTTSCVGTAAAGWYGVLVNATGKIAAIYSAGGAWSAFAAGVTTLALNSGYTLIVVSEVAMDGNGYTVSAYGTGSSSVSGSQTL